MVFVYNLNGETIKKSVYRCEACISAGATETQVSDFDVSEDTSNKSDCLSYDPNNAELQSFFS